MANHNKLKPEHNEPMKQMCQARENACAEQVLVLHLIGWEGDAIASFFKPISDTKRSKAKPGKTIPDYFRHSIENRYVKQILNVDEI